MVQFPSQAWIDQFKEELNKNANYEDAARTWEGDFIFLVLPDEGLTSPVAMYIDLFHGKCRDAKMLSKPDEKPAAYTLEGPFSNWKAMMEGKIEPLNGIMTRKFKLSGNMMKVMRYTRAAKELINTAKLIPTEYPPVGGSPAPAPTGH